MDDLFIQYVDLHKSFDDNHVLCGINLGIRRGETVVVLGGSGSGKSVLLRHTIGLHCPDSGQVLVDGVDITSFGEKDLLETRKKVGMLFQAGALFDSMTVFENISYALYEHTGWEDDRIRHRVDEVLGYVELENVEELMPSDLSGGMRKRVALARAIALAPQAILYDEPTTGLDPIIANTINQLIRSLQDRLGITSIVVTHDIQSAFHVGDRIAFLYTGGILFEGSMDEARTSDEPILKGFLEGGGYG